MAFMSSVLDLERVAGWLSLPREHNGQNSISEQKRGLIQKILA